MKIEAPLVQAQDFAKPIFIVKAPPVEKPLVETAKVDPPKIDKSNEEKQ